MLKYSREQFKAAYSGEDAAEWISWGVDNAWIDWYWETGQAQAYIGLAGDAWAGANALQAIYYLINAGQYLINANARLKNIGGPLLTDYMLQDAWYLSMYYSEIDWKSIMRAWWDAPLAGCGWTIQFIDFMREGVWNEPMNIIEQEHFLS